MHLYEFDWARSGLALMKVSIDPAGADAARKLDASLFVLTRQDPGFGAYLDAQSGRVLLEGQGEPHLSGKLDALLNVLGVDLKIGLAEIVYQEEPGDTGAVTFLQPMMRIEAAVPADRIRPFLVELNSRGGQVVDTGLQGDSSLIVALAPLAGLFGFGPMLADLIGPDAGCTMAFDGYAPVVLPDPHA